MNQRRKRSARLMKIPVRGRCWATSSDLYRRTESGPHRCAHTMFENLSGTASMEELTSCCVGCGGSVLNDLKK
ncbi:hypothetical protein SAMN05216386_0957 [Nitrosospira briensis]|uniref:Uncharacterized protein n=1 Tax=Nitrosospira briensis TaxID=35799 RepID=A0A1I4Z0J4_9PROT|nr:hypothetical protein SAMN05216386_0957 [Nitrosospira briensis]